MTKKRFSRVATVVTVCVLGAIASVWAPAAQADDVEEQVWTDVTYSVPLDKKHDWTLAFNTILRSSEGLSRLTDRRLGVALTRRLNRHASLGGALQFRRIGPSLTNSTRESRYFANAAFQTPLSSRMSIVNRNLLERRDNFPGRDATIYRNRTQLNYATQVFKTRITPYVAGEFFYNFGVKEWFRTRATVGFTHRFSPRVNADFFLTRQIEGAGRSGDLHIVGVNLQFSP